MFVLFFMFRICATRKTLLSEGKVIRNLNKKGKLNEGYPKSYLRFDQMTYKHYESGNLDGKGTGIFFLKG